MPPKKKVAAGASRKSKIDDDTTETGRDEYDDMMNMKSVVKPDDQLQLTDLELKEEYTRVLTANNPHAPQNIVRYSFKERQFKPIPQVEQLAVHFQLEGNLLHKDSDEANRQSTRSHKEVIEAHEEKEEKVEAEVEEDGTEKEGGETEREFDEVQPTGNEKALRNQFNYCERATQTYNNPLRERGNCTEPPPRASFAANITQWNIFDDYNDDFEKTQEKNKEKKPAASTFGQRGGEQKASKKMTVIDSQNDDLNKIANALKIAERMVNQNTYDEISQDFKYYEDESDDYRDNSQGTLLPLWKFNYDKARKLAVTALVWSPRYSDLYAVGHGSYNFVEQGSGLICFYTLKNPSFPEYIYETESGVMCLDIHPDYPYMICVGFYDGAVAVYNTIFDSKAPLYQSTAKTGKHTEPVWKVRWQKDDLDNNMNFFSVSADGRITMWTIVKSSLEHYDVITLQMENDSPTEGPDGTLIHALGSGTTFDFHKDADHLFLVGTEEGLIHKCSKTYNSQFLDTIQAHHMAIYKVVWNCYHSDIYMTCSADWTVKIWDQNKKDPLFVFDMGSPVGDIAWAPYSSTVFAAVCSDGKVHVYDLNINKYEAICVQNVAQKKSTRLTNIGFNQTHPIIIVGDDRGTIMSLKLSPNLRKMPKQKKGAPPPEPHVKIETEIAKLNKIISLVG